MKTDTAHETWNRRWTTAEGRGEYEVPEPDVVRVAEVMARGEKVRALDLGCGIGRHALLFARMGLLTAAVDLAPSGLAVLSNSAAAEGLEIETAVAPMTALPFPDGTFDYVLSFNVIYHGDGHVVAATLEEIRRVLKPGGVFQGTMLSKRNEGYGKGTEIAPSTFVRDAGDETMDDADKIHPHFYCNALELVTLFRGFELRSLFDNLHREPGSWHWHFVADRLS